MYNPPPEIQQIHDRYYGDYDNQTTVTVLKRDHIGHTLELLEFYRPRLIGRARERAESIINQIRSKRK
jgi:hypothetical protein